MTVIPSPLDLFPSGWSILAEPSDSIEEILSQSPGSSYVLSLESILGKQATLPVNVSAVGNTDQRTTFRIPVQLFFTLSALDSSDGASTDGKTTSTSGVNSMAKANSNIRAAYITAFARQIDAKYACKSCKKAKSKCYRANPVDSSIQSIKCASCVASHRVCEIDRNAIDTRLAPGMTLKFSKQTTLDAVLTSDPVQPTSATAPITSYDHLLDHMSDMDRPYYMYLSFTASKPTKDVLSWLEDVFNPCGTKVDGGELCYKVKIGNRANINPFTAIKYAQHVPLPYKIKPQSPSPLSRPASPPPLRSVPPAVDTQPCSSSDQISASSVPPNHDVLSGLKRKFALANPHAGRYLASNKLMKTASGLNVLALSPAGRYDDAEIDERFGDADPTRREEEYEYQTDHSSDDDEDNESVEGRGQDHGAERYQRDATPKPNRASRLSRTSSPDSPGVGRSVLPSRGHTPRAIRHNDFDTLNLPDACSTVFEPAFNANVADDIQTAIAYHRRRIAQVVCQGYDYRDRSLAQTWLDNSLQDFKKLITQDMPSDPEEMTRLLLDDGLAFLMKTLNSQPIFSRQCGSPLVAPLKRHKS